ncbi:FumA C-terminus/TtdB family hydratase beta subunit [Tabrizicola oligotrophica]|uniref:Fumarate hydratase class I n=1 Tax=Tabrizicola oligotrophica TaxID=2710650 RepID=A0A6M0QQY2_9RHOB|nr:FumA C-terminus/TtdB family hydratase beta subunit [Tabrizicola oligotrophica]NEY89491.1 fumarate hydratase [Tabrizicola oligotrophica]
MLTKLLIAGPEVVGLSGAHFLRVDASSLTALTEQAFADVSHLLRTGHLEQLRAILDDPEASQNDRFVALELIKNAVIAAEREFPSCQDTGTAIVTGKKGQNLLVNGPMRAAIEEGIRTTWASRALRYSQMAPLTMYEEKNTGTNLPAQIDIEAVEGEALDLIFMAKGGGSANKTFLYQETRRLLEPDRLLAFFDEKIRTLGTTACPPYHLAIVIGGLSAEQCLKTVKLASARALDDLPGDGDITGRPFRDRGLEAQILDLTRKMGMGAQFGGKYFCHDVRVIRLPRHGGSLPVGMGVSCSADRQIKARIDREGIWLEALERDPARFLPQVQTAPEAVRIDLNQPMTAICAALSKLAVSTPVLLSGTMIVARDLVHAELGRMMAAGQPLPGYMTDHPIYYAGPAKTPAGHASGSFGPTTAARMDPYVPELQGRGASRVMIAKGNRAASVVQSCKAHGGFYLGSVGGAAASLGRDVIRKVEQIDFPQFGMEAVFRIEVQDFPAFVIIDDKGGDFFARPQ